MKIDPSAIYHSRRAHYTQEESLADLEGHARMTTQQEVRMDEQDRVKWIDGSTSLADLEQRYDEWLMAMTQT